MNDLEKALLCFGGIKAAQELIEQSTDHSEPAKEKIKIHLARQEKTMFRTIVKLSVCDGGVDKILKESQKYIFDLL